MAEKKKKTGLPEQETVMEGQEDSAAEELSPEEKDAPKSAPDPLAEAEKKYGELNDRYLRLMAEYENYRKRSTREKIEIYPQATAAAVEKFLPVLDNLERASGFDRTTEDFARGFDMICQSFADVLKLLGVEQLGVVGEEFNPEQHNAVMHIEDPEFGENVVSQVLQKGYRIGDKVIRYAMVQTAN